MSNTPPLPDNNLIEIRDPEIDPAAIMAEIRGRIEQHRRELGYENRRFPTFGTADYPGEPAHQPYDGMLYQHLRLANRHYANVETKPVLVSSPTTRLPVVGRLWSLIRSSTHNLVLFYVNRAVTQQVNINRHLVSVLNRLTAQLQEQEEKIATLQAEIERLKEQ